MGNNITELVFVLDRSGSMSGLERDTIGGFNAALERQRKGAGTCLVTTVLFNSRAKTVHDRLPLSAVEPMTDRDFVVGGCTALMDALGDTIRHIDQIHRYIRSEDVPEHTTFVIMTDGMENASRHFNASAVRAMVRKQQEKRGWEFLFLGANIDSAETAEQIGIPEDRAVDYLSDSQGTINAFDTVAETVLMQRCGSPITANWRERVRRDTDARKHS